MNYAVCGGNALLTTDGILINDDFTYSGTGGSVNWPSVILSADAGSFTGSDLIVSGSNGRVTQASTLTFCNANFRNQGTPFTIAAVNNAFRVERGSGTCTATFSNTGTLAFAEGASAVFGVDSTNSGTIQANQDDVTVSFQQGFSGLTGSSVVCGPVNANANKPTVCNFQGATSFVGTSSLTGSGTANFAGALATSGTGTRSAAAVFGSGASLTGDGSFGPATFKRGSTLTYNFAGSPRRSFSNLVMEDGSTLRVQNAQAGVAGITATSGSIGNINVIVDSLANGQTVSETTAFQLFTGNLVASGAVPTVSYAAGIANGFQPSITSTVDGVRVENAAASSVNGGTTGTATGSATGSSTGSTQTPATPASPPSSPSTDEDDGGISGGAIAGIIVGAVGGLLILIIIIIVVIIVVRKSSGGGKQPVVYDTEGNVLFAAPMDTPMTTPTYGVY